MPKNVRVEWRQGETGLGDVYIFNPNPNPTRVDPFLKQAEFNIPLADGIVIQNLGRDKRILELKGILYAKSRLFEDLEQKRRQLITGMGQLPGQLHFISITNIANPKHMYYVGQVTPNGIVFEEQDNPTFLSYTITITCANPIEYITL